MWEPQRTAPLLAERPKKEAAHEDQFSIFYSSAEKVRVKAKKWQKYLGASNHILSELDFHAREALTSGRKYQEEIKDKKISGKQILDVDVGWGDG